MSAQPLPSCLLAAALGAGSAGAAAADFSIGAGAGVDHARVVCVTAFPCDRSSSFGKLFAGLRPNENLELQAVYFDAGRFEGGGTTPLGTAFGGRFEVTGFGLTGGYRQPLAAPWSLVARAGLASVRTRWEPANPAVAGVGRTTTQPLLGVGLAYDIAPSLRLSADYDFTRFEVHTTRGRLQSIGVAVQYSF